MLLDVYPQKKPGGEIVLHSSWLGVRGAWKAAHFVITPSRIYEYPIEKKSNGEYPATAPK